MCTEFVCIEKLSKVIGRSSERRLMNIPLGVTAEANPCISYRYT